MKKTYVAHCHSELERQDITRLQIQKDICFLIGPEGDFSLKEIQMLKEKTNQGCKPWTSTSSYRNRRCICSSLGI